ncbi:MAG: helix-turn-helix transcriptional regulator [Candidatus Melainabacteria bacterium]|nr:helix-turn-helix transcriptional regulator [Candidatus Melainabacteria bacterium]
MLPFRLRIHELLQKQRKGWSMKTLAEKLDVDHQTVLYWNQGRTYPRLPTLVQLARLLGCPLQDLLEE